MLEVHGKHRPFRSEPCIGDILSHRLLKCARKIFTGSFNKSLKYAPDSQITRNWRVATVFVILIHTFVQASTQKSYMCFVIGYNAIANTASSSSQSNRIHKIILRINLMNKCKSTKHDYDSAMRSWSPWSCTVSPDLELPGLVSEIRSSAVEIQSVLAASISHRFHRLHQNKPSIVAYHVV